MRMSSRPVRSPSIEASPCRERSTSPSGGTGACSLNSSVPASAHSDIWRPIEPLWKRCHAWRSRPVRTTSATTCRAQKLVMQQPDKYRVTRRAQVPKRSFDKLAAAETSPRRMELLGQWAVWSPAIVQQSLRAPTEPILGNFYVRGIRGLAVHESVEKPDGVVFRCGARGRRLEIPAWMFDRSACARVRVAVDAHVNLARPPHVLWGLERGGAVHRSYVVDFARPRSRPRSGLPAAVRRGALLRSHSAATPSASCRSAISFRVSGMSSRPY